MAEPVTDLPGEAPAHIAAYGLPPERVLVLGFWFLLVKASKPQPRPLNPQPKRFGECLDELTTGREPGKAQIVLE